MLEGITTTSTPTPTSTPTSTPTTTPTHDLDPDHDLDHDLDPDLDPDHDPDPDPYLCCRVLAFISHTHTIQSKIASHASISRATFQHFCIPCRDHSPVS